MTRFLAIIRGLGETEVAIIPKTSTETKKKPPVAWQNEDCEREEKIVRAEYRKH